MVCFCIGGSRPVLTYRSLKVHIQLGLIIAFFLLFFCWKGISLLHRMKKLSVTHVAPRKPEGELDSSHRVQFAALPWWLQTVNACMCCIRGA